MAERTRPGIDGRRTQPRYGPGGVPLCKNPDCPLDAYRRGLCLRHYRDHLAAAKTAAAKTRSQRPGRRRRPPRGTDELTESMDWIDVQLVATHTPTDGWQNDARCRDHPDDVIFYGANNGETADARRYCQACPVLYDCLIHALHTGEDHGVWGGCSERERRRLQRVLQRWRRQHGDAA